MNLGNNKENEIKLRKKISLELDCLSDKVKELLNVNHPDYIKKFDGEYKTRNWAFIVYPESSPPDWELLITDLCIPWCHSPVHDKDENPTTGEIKKSHYHCIFLFDGPTTFNNVSSILKSVMGDGYVMPVPCRSIRGAVRYFCHLDNPEKCPYNPSDCFYYASDPYDLVKPTSSEKELYISQMTDFVMAHDIVEYSDLYEYSRLNEPNWFYMLSFNCSQVMNIYIRSRRHRIKSK